MTIGKASSSGHLPTGTFEQVLDSCRERLKWFENMFLGIGEREDALRKALYLASHWAHVVDYIQTGRTNPDLLAFRDQLLWMNKAAFTSLMSKIHDGLAEEFRRGRLSEEHLQFALVLFHCNGSPTLEVFKIIYECRP